MVLGFSQIRLKEETMRKGMGVNGSLEVSLLQGSSSGKRVEYHVGDQFWH